MPAAVEPLEELAEDVTPSYRMAAHRERWHCIPPAVRSELDNILSSDFFRTSKRSQAFLCYVVEAVSCDHSEEIKERTLGTVIWNRPADYDTGTDAIVRVKANEIRRRLAQYNQGAVSDRPVVISLQSGSYVPLIEVRSPQASTATEEKRPVAEIAVLPVTETAVGTRPKRFRLMMAVVVCMLLISATLGALWYRHRWTPIEDFWRPMAGGDVIICTGSPGVYRVKNMQPDKANDASASYRIMQILKHLGASSRISRAEDVSETDLRRGPVVLIGGPKINPWTAAFTQNLRYSFTRVGNEARVVDESSGRYWAAKTLPNGKPAEDYVILTRLVHSPLGQPVIAIAGLDRLGTQSGISFLQDPDQLLTVQHFAPKGWQEKNFQLVLRISAQHGNTELAAATYW